MSRQIPATYMRGGTSKGLFFLEKDLPESKGERDALLLRIVGSPDPYEQHNDGMGGATSSTSKVVMVSESYRDDCDVDYYLGAVSITDASIDYTDSCADLLAAVGPFALARGLVAAREPMTRVRIWQRNLGQRVDAWVPVRHGQAVECGEFREDGLPFASAEVRLDWFGPEDKAGALPLLPSGNVQDILRIDGIAPLPVTLVNGGRPTVFVRATDLGLSGRESAASIQRNRQLLNRLETIRAHGAVLMGLAETAAIATTEHAADPELSWVAAPHAYRPSAGKNVGAADIDVSARHFSLGCLQTTLSSTGSIALAIAAALPGSLVNEVCRALPGVPTRIGHSSGTLSVGAQLACHGSHWQLEKATMSRSARRLMTGLVHVPA